MAVRNVFVIGLDATNVETLYHTPEAEECRFHQLLTIEELQTGEVDMARLRRAAEERLDASGEKPDAIVGYWDFPVSTLVPMLCRRHGLPSADLAAVVRCEHKYWSRLEQRKVISELPAFALVDLDAPRPPEGMRFPMWLKPVKSTSSQLAYKARDRAEFTAAVERIRSGVGRIGRPFQYVLDQLDLPPEIEAAGGQACLAEEELSGDQVAVEGYVHQGDVTVYGILDSLNYPGTASFLRHQYPSSLPAPVQRRLADVSRRVIARMGLDHSTFSIEFFHDPRTGGVRLLEINPRHSQSHAELFEFVEGVPNHHYMISLALGRDPAASGRRGEGAYRVASKWYHRVFQDALVTRVPSRAEVERICREIPGVRAWVLPREGRWLSELTGQDGYSYELAHIYTGGRDVAELREKYDACVAALGIELEHRDRDGDGAGEGDGGGEHDDSQE